MKTWSSFSRGLRLGSGKCLVLMLVAVVAVLPAVALAGPTLIHPPAVPILTIGASPSSTTVGHPFVLAGTYAPINGALVVVHVKKPGSYRWSYSSTRATYGSDGKSGSHWWYRYIPRLRGTYSFNASVDATDSEPAAVTMVLNVNVK